MSDTNKNNDSGASPNLLPKAVVLRIYERAMCCPSGVCGPSVDTTLAQFSGALGFIAENSAITVERYNLGQQPQAFVENNKVRELLGDGGEGQLPFIFINDQLWLKGCYPSRDQLIEALKIPLGASVVKSEGDTPCCGGGGCCG